MGVSSPSTRRIGCDPTLRCTSDAPIEWAVFRRSLISMTVSSKSFFEIHRLDDFSLYLCCDRCFVPQVFFYVFPAMADPVAAVTVPCPGLFDNAFFNTEVDDLAFPRNALVEEDIEFRLPERRRHFVLDDLHPYAA